jgi:hypothetical protein
LSWNRCRYPQKGDIQFDGDGYVVSIRIHRRNRGGKSFEGGYFRVDGLPLQLGTVTLQETLAKRHGTLRTAVDPEFGTVEVASYDFFELEFDQVGAEKVLGAIHLIR